MLKWVQDNPGYQKKYCSLFQQLNNASQRADLLEQKQSISNLESSQITTSVAKASWHFHRFRGCFIYFSRSYHMKYVIKPLYLDSFVPYKI